MKDRCSNVGQYSRRLSCGIAVVSVGVLAGTMGAVAQNSQHGQGGDKDHSRHFFPGNLVVSRSVYDNNANNVKVGTILPPDCASTQGGCAGPNGAPFNGTYPLVWNDEAYDASFGITSKILLDQITPSGRLLDTLEVPNSSSASKGKGGRDQLVTSFPSKSEIALHLSTDGKYLTFMGYVAPVNAIDVSNSNTVGAVDP